MEEEIDIKDLMLAIWRKKWIILSVTIIFFVIGLIYYIKNNETEDKLFGSENTELSNINYVETDFVFASPNQNENMINQYTYKVTIDSSVISNLNAFATSKSFLKSVLQELDVDEKIDIKDVQAGINIFGSENSDIMTLVVALEDKDVAQKISNKILNELTNKINKVYKIEEIITVNGPTLLDKEGIEEVKNEIKKSINIDENNKTSNKEDETFGSLKKKVILITIVGFVLACGVVVMEELFDGTVKDEEILEKATNSKTLAKIPKNSNDIDNKFNILRVNVNECKTILVTSPEKMDGKSFVANNLAKAFARLGKKVVLVDLEKNSSELIKKFDGRGLVDYLRSKENFVEKYIVETTEKNLSVLLSGKDLTNQTELLDSDKMKETLEILGRLYDVIIIDSSNVLESANTLTIAKKIKYTILVVSERKTSLKNVIKAKNNIEDIGGIIIGNVFCSSIKK